MTTAYRPEPDEGKVSLQFDIDPDLYVMLLQFTTANNLSINDVAIEAIQLFLQCNDLTVVKARLEDLFNSNG